MVAAPAAERVEVRRRHALILQVLASRAILGYRAGGGDVVSRDRVAEQGEHAGVLDVLRRIDLRFDVVKERRLAHVCRLVVPGVHAALGNGHAAPRLVAVKHRAVALDEVLALDCGADRVGDLLR